ncbi:lysophospholipase [Defluviimonas sp. 20V17]|uniref:Lysophospholipase n=1 Tax=Allgaiera indica TaxID=765699 RepID=A0AAN4UV74_9RHOB|nr:DUF1489 domain-containing protein [Allgaiera indica]KDB05181.1 lysophospholipase [Defluviimonas sp. 20V17]GHE05282.1 lysophospholipase [Allgaiera indica]SDX62549.1 hypothetical protein SAMN05444006_1224 [Allgaiera indica]
MADFVNLLKLCVGADEVQDLLGWQAMRRAENPGRPLQHVTRMWPKREAEVLAGGSLYWVFKGVIGARQRITGMEERIGADGVRRCALILDDAVIRTEPAPRRPFQGWRYLAAQDAPRDLPTGRAEEEDLPPELAAALAEIGLR